MATEFKPDVIGTYANRANARKAVEKRGVPDHCHYVIMQDEVTGRYYPLFIGLKNIEEGVHFFFHVVDFP
jgi:hypothetical protein